MKVSYLDRLEKENSYGKEQQNLRTAEYPHVVSNASNLRSPKNNGRQYQDNHETAQFYQGKTASSTRNTPKNYRYEPDPDNERFLRQNTQGSIGKYNARDQEKYENYQPYEKFLGRPGQEQRQTVLKARVNRTDYQEGFSDNNSFINGQARRDNARAKGFDMKMNNIDNISDKIGSLLSMVKKDNTKTPKKYNDLSSNTPSKSKQKIEATNLSPKNSALYRNFNDNSQLPSNKDNSRRMKTYSAYDKRDGNDYPLNNVRQEYLKYNNQEDLPYFQQKKLIKRDYSPSGNKYPNLQRYNHEENISPKIQSSSSKAPLYNRHPFLGQPQEQKLSPKEDLNSFEARWNQGDKEFIDDSFQFKQTKFSRMPQEQPDNFIPYSLQNIKRYAQEKQQGAHIIDERLKRIHQKILESENGKNRIERRLEEKINQYEAQMTEEAKAGHLYRRTPPPAPQKSEKFELKVHPVKVDRENVVKIALVLESQAMIDKKLMRLRQQFLKEQSPDKWTKLQSQLRESGVKLTMSQIQQLVAIGPEQFSLLQDYPSSSCEQLGNLLAGAQKHWQNKVCGCVYMRALKGQGFSEADIDLGRKGYICQEDIMEFIALYTGRSLLQRDIALLFRRLQLLQGSSQPRGVSFNTFIRVVAL